MSSEVKSQQPEPAPSLSVESGAFEENRVGDKPPTRLQAIREKLTTRDGWIGNYDYRWYVDDHDFKFLAFSNYFSRLCMPSIPFRRRKRTLPPFFGLDDDMPLVLAMTSGLQHALAMLAGLITPPIIFASALNLDSETSAYMISASLIGCGKCNLWLFSAGSHQD